MVAGQAQVKTGVVEQLYLYAFATQAEVLHHVKTEAVMAERERLDKIMRAWKQAQIRVEEIMQRERKVADAVRYEPIGKEWNEWLANLSRELLFQKTFQNLPVSFRLVEVDCLIAPQRTVNATYVEELKKNFPKELGMKELLEICLSPKAGGEKLKYLQADRTTHVFSSPNTDVRFLGSSVKPIALEDLLFAEAGGVPAASVIAFVGYGYAPINVFLVGSRAVLNNGFHRVYALRSLGVKKLPVVVQHITRPELEFPRRVVGLPRDYLLGAARPVLVKDFFEPGFTLRLAVQQRLRVIKVHVNVSDTDVPV